ncbi:MAG: HlyD family type I secretion periplasmic adaptor subunit [Rhodospirillales bacterium]|nr:HlyD family type I secretion periplasmic adaptor subunit [Rhodospirillales bacterium]MCB9972928.1 HlyD family type I secretion periplasmic adaptor subunit [Rhodospirillales bacterium]MCB9980134.1 HlyD family type I secretion periplasmic adaptor subunit [Rhodospirillales bacterium]
MTKDTDFMDELDAVAKMRPREGSRVLLFTIFFLIVFFGVWASVSQIEQLARGEGQVVPSAEIQVVQSLEGGIVQELLVSEGDRVEKDQVLLRLSDVFFASEERGTQARFLGLQAKRARLRAEAKGEEFSLPEDVTTKAPDIAKNEMALYASRQAEYRNQKSILEEKINAIKSRISEAQSEAARYESSRASLQKELEITKKMVEQRAVPELEKLRLERDVSDSSGRAREARQRAEGLRAELSATENELKNQADEFRTKALGELNDVDTQLSALEENLKSIGDRVYRTDVRAPVAGIVDKISIKTIGGIIEPAKPIVEIVPLGDDLKIIAKVSPNDIAFLKLGQDVNVKISAYDPQRYGSLKGKLVRIGANSVKDNKGGVFFEVEVRTEKTYLGTAEKPFPITTGMLARIEIITGKRTIMEYLLKPILRARSVALTER